MKFSFLCLLAFLAGTPLHAQAPATPGANDRLTEITSERLLFDYPNRIAVFTGNVVVTDPDLQITADVLTIHLNEDDSVDRIEARGNVIIKTEGLHSRSGRAVYTLADQVMVLEDRPQVFRENSVLTADRITYFRNEERLLAEPQPRLLLFQDAEREFNLRL